MIDRTVEEIYNTHGFYLFKRCQALLGSEEEAYDAMHEVFVKLMVSRPTLDHDRPVLAWLNRVATSAIAATAIATESSAVGEKRRRLRDMLDG